MGRERGLGWETPPCLLYQTKISLLGFSSKNAKTSGSCTRKFQRFFEGGPSRGTLWGSFERGFPGGPSLGSFCGFFVALVAQLYLGPSEPWQLLIRLIEIGNHEVKAP